jgi:Arm DNA-binding domain
LVATNSVKLTKRTVDALTPRNRPFIAFDADLKGFGLRVMPTGSKTFILEYRPGAGGRGVAKRRLSRLHQLSAIFAILGASDRDKSLDLHGWGLRKRL